MRLTLALTAGLCAAIGCRDDARPGPGPGHHDGDTGDTPADDERDPGASLRDVASPADLACALTFTVAHDAWSLPAHVTLTDPDGGVQTRPVHWNGQTGRVVGLRADTDYTLSVGLVAGEGEPDPPTLQAVATTSALPADLPDLTLSASEEALSSGDITVFPVARWNPMTDPGWGYILAVDSEGEVVWYWDAATLMVAFHVESDEDGVPWVYTSDFLRTAVAVSPFTGEVRRLEASAMGLDSVHHEVRPLPGGGLAVLSTELEQIGGFDGQTYNIVADLLVEAEWDGTVTYQAGILDHVDPTTVYTADMHAPFWEAGPYATVASPKDWSHGNAMELDAAGDQWIVSFRNLDWLMAFDRATGAPNWAFGPLGDFTLAEGSRWASRQHSPEVTPDG
ncbi:MAG: aryl-sulfate sulfotransferase, partial [Myxococcota bacterium]|nr:aryl-sulfate sulfotransferase [Myxococcota bacterium]